MSVINITSYNGSKLGLSTDKFNKYALPRGTRLLSGIILPRSTSSFTKVTPSGSGSYLKHRISKREYKVVLSKTYIRSILLMLKYQGKGRWGFTCRSASFDLANPVLRVPDFEVRSVHESTTCLQTIHHYGYFLDFRTKKHTIALTLILRIL